MTSEEANNEVRRTALSILSYLRAHPRAEDTASGIAEWWVHEDSATVEKALRLLTAEGVVEMKGKVYRLKDGSSGQNRNDPFYNEEPQ